MATTMSRFGRRAPVPALVAPCGESGGGTGGAPEKGARERAARWEEASAAAAAALRQRELEEGAAEALAGGLLGAALDFAPTNGGAKVSDKLRASSTPARARAQKRHLEEDRTAARQSPARRSARPSRSSASAPAWLSPNSRTATSGSSGAPSPSINHHAASDAAAHDREMDYELKDADDGSEGGRGRSRLVWTPELHERFMNAVNHLGVKHAVPKTILQLMNVEGLTRENVASHLQKYRLYLKRLAGVPLNAPISAEALQRVQEVQQQAVALQQNAPQWPPPQYAPRPPLRLEDHQRDAAAHDPALAQIASLSQAAGSSAGTSVGATAVQLSVRELDLHGSLSAVQRMRSASCSEAESQRSAPTDTASSDGGSGALDTAAKGPRLSVNEYAAWMGTYPGMDFKLPSSQELGFRLVRAAAGVVAGFGSPLPSPAASPTAAAAAAAAATSQGPAAVAAAASGAAPGVPAPPPLWQPVGQVAGVPITGGTAALQLSTPADAALHMPVGTNGNTAGWDVPPGADGGGAPGDQLLSGFVTPVGAQPEAAGPSSFSAVATTFQATAVKEEGRAADGDNSGMVTGDGHAAPTPGSVDGTGGRGSPRSHPLDLPAGSPSSDAPGTEAHGRTRAGRAPQHSPAGLEGRPAAMRTVESAAAALAMAEAAEIAALAEREVLSGEH